MPKRFEKKNHKLIFNKNQSSTLKWYEINSQIKNKNRIYLNKEELFLNFYFVNKAKIKILQQQKQQQNKNKKPLIFNN